MLAHPKSMCYLIADEGSACPTSNSISEMDRAGLLFFYLNFERTKDNGYLYVEKKPKFAQNVHTQNVCIRMLFWPEIVFEK